MNRSIEFYLGMSREMKALKCSEMYIGVDDMEELITRLRQAEKDAERYRFIKQWNQSYSLNVYRKDLWDDVVDKAMWMESQCNK